MAERYSRFPSIDDIVVVVGAGIAGSTVANELALRGQKTLVIEKRRPHSDGRIPGQERSEMTLSSSMATIGTTEGITGPLTQVTFVSLDNGAKFSHSLPTLSNLSDNVAVYIDHQIVLRHLWRKMNHNDNIAFQTGTSVNSIEDLPGGEGVAVKIDGKTKYVRAVVNATGPSWNGLPFNNPNIQEGFENAIVAVAYGRRYRGEINMPDGDKTMLLPVSTSGSGRTSWVTASGPNQIDIVFSDYVLRKDVGRIQRERGYQLLLEKLRERKLVTLYEEGPIISGFIGLDARLKHAGNEKIFHFGEKGQYNSATVGDAIAPTIRLASPLADMIVQGRPAKDFEKITQQEFNHRLEMATTRSRMKAPQMGEMFQLFEVVKWLSAEQQADFLRTHKIPVRHIPQLIIRYPHLIQNIMAIAQEYMVLSL